MIRAEIPQDVTDYKEEFFFGLTLRKLVSAIAAIAIVAVVYFLGSKIMDTSVVIYIAALLCAPIILVGFKEVNGMPFEKYAMLIWRFFTGEQRRKFIYLPVQVKYSEEITAVLLEGEKILRKEEIRQNKKQSRLDKKNAKKEKKANKERKRKRNAD